MTKRIIYIHPGDMVEIRFCDPDYEPRAREWEQRLRSLRASTTIRFDSNGALEVFDSMIPVFEGTGDSRRQLLVKQ